LRILESLSPSW